MIRNSKALGLALLATFSFSAMAASGASASSSIFDSEIENATILTGTSENDQVFMRGIYKMTCSHAEFEGTQAGASTTTMEIEAIYTTTSCLGPLNSQVHADFTTGDCGYHFTGTASKTAVEKLACNAPGGQVTLTATNSDGSSLCTIHIPPQTFGGHVVFSNIEMEVEGVKVNAVTSTSTLAEITSTRTGSALCGPENHAVATYTGNATISGEGGPVNIEVT